MLSDFYQLIDEEKIEEAEVLLNDIENIVGDTDPEISGAWVTIDFEKMRREAE